MSDFDRRASVPTDDALEQLLKHAAPRPTPSQSDEAAVRQAVRSEWRHVTGRYRSRRRVLQYAIAATVLIGVFSVFSVFRLPAVEAVQVATIEKSFGSIYLLGEESELRETRDLSTVLSGQTIVTGNKTGIALAWDGGGSLRVDENSRVKFRSENAVYVQLGRIYFDSEPAALVAGTSAGGIDGFVVLTDYGEIAHLGTQFMTDVNSGELTVSVREGQVAVDGQYHSHVATSGQQVRFSGRQKPAVLSISRFGNSWDWVSRTSPATNVDGKTLHEYLLWACRELGLELEYEGEAEHVARLAKLKGAINSEPAEAMKHRMATAALESRIDEGVIYVSKIR